MTEARGTAPTAAQIDTMGREYLELDLDCQAADKKLAVKHAAIVDAVHTWGAMPPRAEKSLRLSGSAYQLTVTQSDSVTIKQEPAALLDAACRKARVPSLFRRLFRVQKQYTLQRGAQQAAEKGFAQKMEPSLRKRIRSLFAQAMRLKKGSPHVKVEPIEKPKDANS